MTADGTNPDATATGERHSDASGFAGGRAGSYGANTPFALDGSDVVRLVTNGALDVFLQRGTVDAPRSRRHFLLRVPPGGAALPIERADVPEGYTVVAVGEPDTTTSEIDLAALLAAPDDVGPDRTAYRRWIEAWKSSIGAIPRVRTTSDLTAGEHTLAAGQAARVPGDGAVIEVTSGALSVDDPTIDAVASAAQIDVDTGPVALPAAVELRASGDATVLVTDPLAGTIDQRVVDAIGRMHHLLLAVAADRIGKVALVEDERFDRQRAASAAALRAAAAEIAGVLDTVEVAAETRDDPFDRLLRACRRLGEFLDAEFIDPPASYREGSDPITAISMAAGVRHRRISLDRGFERRGSSPVLAYRRDDRRPIALVPRTTGGYVAYDPVDESEQRLDATLAASLDPVAYEFYTPLPARPLSLRDLARVGFRHQHHSVRVLVVAGVIGGLLALALPIATSLVFDQFIPDDDLTGIAWAALFLAAALVSGAFMSYARSLAVVRLSGNMNAVLQAGVWDRLLSLPTSFHLRYSTGDLTSRAYGVQSINAVLTNATVSAILSTAFGTFSLVLLFFYSPTLAVFALAGLLVVGVVLALLSIRQVRYQRTMFLEKGHIFGRLFQLLQGVEKIRIAGKEIAAFGEWAGMFRRQQEANYRGQLIYCWLAAIIAGTPLVLSILVFVVVADVLDNGLATGTFVSSVVALGQFTAAATQLNFALVASITVIPLYERLRPIVQAIPESNDPSGDPGLLTGRIRLERVTFAYGSDADPTLRDITLDVDPGQHVAIVGPSGAGKSTIVRLLLGFETPSRGSVAYDGRNLDALNLRMLRRQIGVVLQESKPMPGDILSNIIGSSNLTIDDAWEAAEAARLADDIRAMPMGMRTIVSENGSTFSGGQVQRLLVARAIAHRPRILFFDEATSALDNETQQALGEAIARLDATRVVIAHRLSTIRDADLIYVIDGGQLVQRGTYDELMSERGLFATLAGRQLT